MASKKHVLRRTELCVPQKRILRSDGALYLVLLGGVILVILLANYICKKTSFPSLPVHAVLYAVLLGIGYLVYRKRLVSYRYLLFDDAFEAYRVVGTREKLLAAISLNRITSMGAFAPSDAKNDARAFVGKRDAALCIRYTDEAGVLRALCISPTEPLRAMLLEGDDA